MCVCTSGNLPFSDSTAVPLRPICADTLNMLWFLTLYACVPCACTSWYIYFPKHHLGIWIKSQSFLGIPGNFQSFAMTTVMRIHIHYLFASNSCSLSVFIYLFYALAELGLHCCTGLSLVVCTGFRLQWLLFLQSMGSRACRLQQQQVGSAAVALTLRMQASVAVIHIGSIAPWHVGFHRQDPSFVSLVLQGGFSTTGHQGSPLAHTLCITWVGIRYISVWWTILGLGCAHFQF